MSNMIGETISHYRITGQLGSGGMGVVFKAEDTNLDRTVALKFLAPHLLESEEHKQRFLREAKAAASLDHPNICIVYEVGEAEGRIFLSMGYIDGAEVTAKIKERPLKLDEALDIAIQAAEGLQAAHRKGIVHRDIKSANLMLTRSGQVKVMDFGLAQLTGAAPLTGTDARLGTPSYMSPEQAQGLETDRRTDIWSLGVVLYEMVTGRLPFAGEREAAVVHSIIHEPHEPITAVRSGVPLELDRVVGKALAKNPDERYQHLDDMLVDLRGLTGQSGEIRSPAPVQPAAPASTLASSRRRWLWAAGALPLAAGAGWLGLQQRNKLAAPATGPRLSDGARPSSNREANDYYERGLLFSGGGPRSDLVQWRKMLERALALDPKFAAARGQSAFTLMLPAYFGISSDPSMFYKAEDEARQALRDDPACAVAHSALAGIYLSVGRKELVPGEAEKALQSNPNDPAIHLWFPMYHRANGDYGQAVQQMKKILARWPTFTPTEVYLAEALREQGDTPGMIRELQRMLETDPENPQAHWGIANAHMDSGDLPKARQMMEKVDVRHRPNYYSRLVWALLFALEARKTEALQEMDEQTLTFAGASYLGPLQPAEVYAVLGDTAKALDWLDRAARWGDEREDWLRRDPHPANIRNHPRFQQVLESVAYRRRQRSAASSGQQ